MNKIELCNLIENYINGIDTDFSVDVAKCTDELDAYFYRTAIRIKKAFDIYKKDACYINDFLIALRDFLLVFETDLEISSVEIPANNDYAIKKNETTGKYFCSFQFPDGVINSFAEAAFMRGVENKKTGETIYNLLTDPLIYKITGFKRFKSMSQKLAVYGALNTPLGYTSLVSLPTGGGKSLITQMLGYQSEGLTIVIVPTVSLADDQLIAAKQIIKRNSIEEEVFSYRSGVEVAPILSAIQKHSARLLFISPEAIMNNPVFEEVISVANKQHYLRNIVVDEAHIVVDWGASFRVDYQCLEAWRKNLMLSNPMIRTILLSATYENIAIDVLKRLFSDTGKWIEIRCDALRHEPRYMLIREKNYKAKNSKTVDLVRKLPHPMIIYVARPDDAEKVKRLLSAHGINNVHTYTGLTNNDQREKLLKLWKANDFEIMIATSAFGVGVDKPDVRTVIHLYIPQNPNAYYQELGRGGRDQLPCLSVMCIYPDDIEISFKRISKRVMTTEKIIGRWNSMYNNKASIRSGNIVHIDTSIKPNYSAKDEWDDSPTSEADMNWNIYVLLLFRRFDLIRIVSITKNKDVYIFSIEILNKLLLQQCDEQNKLVEQIRSAEWNYYNNSYKTMERAIRESSSTCWSQMFFDTYDKVNEFCAGCNSHSKINNNDNSLLSLKKSIKSPLREIKPDQINVFEGQDELAVLAREDEKINVIEHLNGMRLSCLISSDKQLEKIEFFERIKTARNTYIVGYHGAKELLKKSNYYYISGIVAVIYPDKEKEIVDVYNMVNKYLVHQPGIYVVHILSENIYIASIGKNITDLIEGRVIKANDLKT